MALIPMPSGTFTRRTALLAAVASVLPSAAHSEGSYPERPIMLLVPWPAGGSTDLSMRVLATEASKKLGVPIIVENRPGGSGSMAMPLLQNAKPDGYVIAQLPQTVFRVVHTQKVLWDPIRDITPLLQISGYTFGIVVATNSEIRTIGDMFAWAKSNPGLLSVGSNGIGTTPHLAMEELFARYGLRYIHVPYKGTAEQMLAVASGQLMVGVNSTGFGPYVESGRLRLLATFGDKRSKRWPDAPTMKELGYNMVAMSPYGIVGPRNLPKPIAHLLHDAFKEAMLAPAHQQEIAKYDQDLAYLNPEDYAKSLVETYEREKEWVQRLAQVKP
jgi:tripartite-type tricarboxylate transporter receptor subunit TctC